MQRHLLFGQLVRLKWRAISDDSPSPLVALLQDFCDGDLMQDLAAVAEALIREEIARQLGADVLGDLSGQVEIYTPENMGEPLLSLRLTPLALPASPRGAAWHLRSITNPNELAVAVREMTRSVLHQLRQAGGAPKG